MARQVGELSLVREEEAVIVVGRRIVRFMCKDNYLSPATPCVSITSIILVSQVMERLLLRKKTLNNLHFPRISQSIKVQIC